jgi:hypothetical protein
LNTLHFGGEWSLPASLVVAAVLSAAAFWLYRRETRSHANPSCRWLPWLRAGAVFLVVLMLSGPVIRHRKMQGTLTRLLVCVDGSQSMGLSDPEMEPERKVAIARSLGWFPAGATGEAASENGREAAPLMERFDKTARSERVRSLLFEGGEAGLLASLAGRFDIQLLSLENSGVRLLWQSGEGLEKLPSSLPESGGVSTDLLSAGLWQAASPLRHTESGGGASLKDESQTTAVMLLTDGQHNTQRSPIALAKELGDRRIPVYALGYGAARAPADLAVLSVEAPETVYFEDRVSGTVVLKDDMPAGQEYRVKVECAGRVVWEKTLVTSRRHLMRVPFDFPVADSVREAQGAVAVGERRSVRNYAQMLQ